MIIFVMIMAYMSKMIINMQFLLYLEMFKIIGFEFDHAQMSIN